MREARFPNPPGSFHHRVPLARHSTSAGGGRGDRRRRRVAEKRRRKRKKRKRAGSKQVGEGGSSLTNCGREVQVTN